MNKWMIWVPLFLETPIYSHGWYRYGKNNIPPLSSHSPSKNSSPRAWKQMLQKPTCEAQFRRKSMRCFLVGLGVMIDDLVTWCWKWLGINTLIKNKLVVTIPSHSGWGSNMLLIMWYLVVTRCKKKTLKNRMVEADRSPLTVDVFIGSPSFL